MTDNKRKEEEYKYIGIIIQIRGKPLIITFEQDADHNNLFPGLFICNYDYPIEDVSLWIPSIIK